MKILLISPPYYKLFGSFNNRINIGLHTLSEILQLKGCETKLLNLDHNSTDKLLSRKDILNNSYQPDDSIIEEARLFLLSYIEGFQPDAIICSIGDIVIPSLDSGSPEIAESIGAFIKQEFPEVFSIAYGPMIRKNKIFDLTIEGYGEQEILSLIKNRKKGYVKATIQNPDLENTPFLTLDNLEYQIDHQDFDYIWQSRGCSFNCSFCQAPDISKGKILRRSARRFLDEIEFRKEKYGVNNFYFTDLTFNASTKHLKETCQGIIDRNLKIDWRCDARIDLITEEQAEYLKKANCNYVKLGIESMNNTRLEFLNKGFTKEIVLEKIKILNEYGLKKVIYILLGHPNYKTKDYLEEYKYFEDLNADKYTVSILNPLPHTKLNRQVKSSFYPIASHLSLNLANHWEITPEVLKKFYTLETTKGREDGNIRNFVHSN